MRIRRVIAAFFCAALLLQALPAAQAQVPPPPPVPPTIWSFMGIPQAYYKIRGTVNNRRGNHPATEPKPPLKNLADPANLESPYEAVKTAAEVKQAEDAAPQKIKGIKYLAKIGCACYDKEEQKITKAMLAGLNDCTESVRLATVEAIAEAAKGETCQKCGSRSCCKKDIILKLAIMAYERDDFGCYLEPSEDVRQAAAEAIQICCPSTIPVEVIQEGEQKKGEPTPAEEPQRKGEPTPDETAKYYPTRASVSDAAVVSQTLGKIESNAELPGNRLNVSVANATGAPSMRLSAFIDTAPSQTSDPLPAEADVPVAMDSTPPMAPQQVNAKPVKLEIDLSKLQGEVQHVDQIAGFVTIQIQDATDIPIGTRVNLYHKYLLGESHVGQVQVVHTSRGSISARSVSGGPLKLVARGDRAAIAR